MLPLSQVANVRHELEEPVLWRRNRDMAITVRADVNDGEQGVSVTQEIQPMLKDIEAKLASGYRLDVGGAVEESDKANKALLAVAPLMLATIMLLLMLQLQDFSRMWMVLLTAPLGLIGVVPALLAFQAPLGFVAILGIIALGGMIMRNSVILIDQVQIEIAAGSSRGYGVREVTLLGQNVNSYGRDLPKRSGSASRTCSPCSTRWTASTGSATRARTRRTCARTSSAPMPSFRRCASTSTSRSSPGRALCSSGCGARTTVSGTWTGLPRSASTSRIAP